MLDVGTWRLHILPLPPSPRSIPFNVGEYAVRILFRSRAAVLYGGMAFPPVITVCMSIQPRVKAFRKQGKR